MNWQKIYSALKSDYLKLLPIMGLAFYVAFIPHQSYSYPVHIDEWFHWALSNEVMIKAKALGLEEPFSGGAPFWNQYFELGFYVFFGIFQRISAIQWLDIIRYFPSIIFMVTVLSTYVLAKRQGFGWQAALFTCLLPTNVGVLGPAFLVPVALGLLFIPLSIFLVLNFRNVGSYLVLLALIGFLASMHAATAIGIAIIIAPFLVLNLRGEFKHSLVTVLVFGIPILGAFPWVFDLFVDQAKTFFQPKEVTWYVNIPHLVRSLGYPLLILCLLGVFILTMRGGKKNHGLVLGLLALLAVLVIFFTFHYGIPSIYERGLVYAMLIVGVVAGAGLMGVQMFRLPSGLVERSRMPFITKNIGVILCLAAIILTLTVSIPIRQNTLYYHTIDQDDYEAFVWIRDNVGKDYDRAILDPWEATAFTAITGKYVYARTHTNPTSKDFTAYDFLQSGAVNSDFLRENGISIIYNKVKNSNPDLVEVRKNVYLFKRTG